MLVKRKNMPLAVILVQSRDEKSGETFSATARSMYVKPSSYA